MWGGPAWAWDEDAGTGRSGQGHEGALPGPRGRCQGPARMVTGVSQKREPGQVARRGLGSGLNLSPLPCSRAGCPCVPAGRPGPLGIKSPPVDESGACPQVENHWKTNQQGVKRPEKWLLVDRLLLWRCWPGPQRPGHQPLHPQLSQREARASTSSGPVVLPPAISRSLGLR